MRYLLTKLSAPGWEVQFNTENDAKNHLLSYICLECKQQSDLSLDSLLSTPCGCEFWFDDINYANP